MKWYTELAISSLQESALFGVGCAVVALIGEVVFRIPFLDGLGLVLLIVSAGLMLVGGALSFVTPANVKVVNALTNSKLKSSPEDFRRTRNRAALFALAGMLLFVYSLILAALLA